MPTFTPPTVKQSISGDRLFSRFGMQVGQSVVKRDGTYQLTPYPWLGEIADLEDGVDYFLGGHRYQVPEDIATALEGDGFTVVRGEGYGEGQYSEEEYGE